MFSLALHPPLHCCTLPVQSPESRWRVSDSGDHIEGEEQRELKTFKVQFKHLRAEDDLHTLVFF